MKINQMVQTPNGPGRLVSSFRLPEDDVYGLPPGRTMFEVRDEH